MITLPRLLGRLGSTDRKLQFKFPWESTTEKKIHNIHNGIAGTKSKLPAAATFLEDQIETTYSCNARQGFTGRSLHCTDRCEPMVSGWGEGDRDGTPCVYQVHSPLPTCSCSFCHTQNLIHEGRLNWDTANASKNLLHGGRPNWDTATESYGAAQVVFCV